MDRDGHRGRFVGSGRMFYLELVKSARINEKRKALP